jgi:hypothetical protein
LLPLLQTSLTDERYWPLLGMGALALVYVVLRPMMKRKRDPMERAPTFSSMAQQRAVERQMQNLLVDLNEMARQISAQLDTRAARLNALIQEADQKIAELRAAAAAASSRAGSDERFDSSHGETSASAPASAVRARPGMDPRHADVYALADEGLGARDIAARLDRPSGEIELILALRSPE